MTEQFISIERMEEAINLFGAFDENIRIIEQELGVPVKMFSTGPKRHEIIHRTAKVELK